MSTLKKCLTATVALMAGGYIMPGEAFAITITSTVQGSSSLTKLRAPNLQNGGFLITPKGSSQPLGDGVDEVTSWNFDFNDDPNFSSFLTSGPVTSAKLSLTLSPKDGLFFGTDTTGIPGVKEVSTSNFSGRPPAGSIGTATLDLFKDGFNSQTLLGALSSGKLPWFYQDDAIVSAAKLELGTEGGNPQGGNPQGGNPQGGDPQGGNPQGGDPQNVKPIPESSSVFGLLAFGALGLGMLLKRKSEL